VSWKEAKQMDRKQSSLVKIWDDPMFHLGTTGNDDETHIIRVITLKRSPTRLHCVVSQKAIFIIAVVRN
jgi:hypothetical protein